MYLEKPPVRVTAAAVIALTSLYAFINITIWVTGGRPLHPHNFREAAMVTGIEVLAALALLAPLLCMAWNYLLAPAFAIPRIRLTHAIILIFVSALLIALLHQ